jgi:pimeloyl-ACP methyl ester carboxylesterase
MKIVLTAFWVWALSAGATIAYGEIQVLFRGQCLTDEQAEQKLEQFGAEYHTAAEWQSRAARIRDGILRGAKLERLPPACPLNTIRHSVRKEDGYTVENMAFESLPNFWVTGNLYLPTAPAGKIAGVLCPHGHLADNRMLEPTQVRCAALARMGAAVFAYDMVGYGESIPVPHHHSEALRLQTYNSMRAVDFLLSLGIVDENRLGVTGESGGGTQSFLLAAIDPRIALSVPVVMVAAGFYGGCICESGMPIHKSADHETNNVEIAASFAPKPQLIISDGADWTKNVPRVEFPYIQRVYALMGAPNNVENAHFADEKHDYGPSKRTAMYPFMAKHLGLDLSRICDSSGKIDESFVKVHERKDLLVFPPDRPRPARALIDAEKVIAELDRR